MTPFNSAPVVTDDEISGEEKLRRVAKLVKELRADLKEVNFLPHERNAAMEQLKVFGRNAKNADPIFTTEGIEILTQHSFHTTSPTTSRAALQCLANALLGTASTRQIFVDLGYSPKAVARLKNPKKDDELLMSRILFLTSYGTTQSFIELIDRHHLADHINDNIGRHARRYAKLTPKKPPDAYEDSALSETLKLLFNITHFCPNRISCFSKSLSSIFKIIGHLSNGHSPPLKPPLNHLVNALLNFPPCSSSASPAEAKKLLPGKSELKPVVARLLSALDSGLAYYAETDLEANLMPLLTLLKHIFSSLPPEIQSLMRTSLVPPSPNSPDPSPAEKPLSLKVLQHLRAPRSAQLHDAISGLLFEIAGRDAWALGASFGIGFASGFLLSRNGQMASVNSEYAESARSLNARHGSLSGAGSARGSMVSVNATTGNGNRNSSSTGISQGSGGMLSPPLPEGRRGSSASGPMHSPPQSQKTSFEIAELEGSSTDHLFGAAPSWNSPGYGANPIVSLTPPVSQDIFELDAGTTPSQSGKDAVPEEYDIVLETRKAWVSGSLRTEGAKPVKAATAPVIGLGIGTPHVQQRPRHDQAAKNREIVVVDDILGPVTKRFSEMTCLVLDDA